MQITPNLPEAYKLLHDGILAFSRAEQEGMRIDVDYCIRQKARLDKKVSLLENKIRKTKFYSHWERIFGAKSNPDSNWQLAHMLYAVKKIAPTKVTPSGKGATDDEALSQIDLPEIKWLLEMRKLKKVRDTYLDAFLREQVDGYLHPFFNLHTVKTFRSCIAEGSKVLVMRNFESHPDGVPIETVQKGDFVYCFDDELRPSIQKVLWAGKTGHKKVVRIHYSINGGGGKGYLDVTPEHKIRLIDGTYVPAEDLLKKDRRSATDNKHLPKVRVLSCKRVGDQLRFTGHLRYGNGILEHRFIYENFIGILNSQDVVHHKDGNHLNHAISNLEKLNKSEHASHHANIAPEELVQYRTQVLKANRHKITYKRGADHHGFFEWSRFKCLRMLAKAKGRLTKGVFGFSTMKRHLKELGIDVAFIKLRYDVHGNYISRKRLKALSEKGIARVQKELGMNYYKLKQLYAFYQIPFTRKWRNQFGEFQVGNHIITKVEYLDEPVDVYDIEVEKYHNFIVNQICVHNSSERINFQNIPKRDKEAMEITRKAIFPKPGHQLFEVDYSGIEVRISTCYHHDPAMRKYIEDPTTDMHGDMASQIFVVEDFERHKNGHGVLRNAAKNGFVFPQFYGDYYVNCTENMAIKWCGLSKGKWKSGEGIEFNDGYISDHLINQGINSYSKFESHVQKIEEDFWYRRFKVYSKWKERWWEKYQEDGYVSMYTGFKCGGIMRRNECINIPIQGSAFHCLLWSFIQIDRISREENWKSRIIGQIHDAMVLDVHPDELDIVAAVVHRVTCEDLPKHWTWINVPLEIEAEVCPVDGSWNEKQDYKF